MSNENIVECVWNSVVDNRHMKVANNVHKQTGMAVEYILKNSLLRRTLDNVTVVMIAFKNFKRAVFGEDRANEQNEEEKKIMIERDLFKYEENWKKENIPPTQ